MTMRMMLGYFLLKTGAASNADFVIPAVAAGKQHRIKVMIAVKVSFNGRAKLVKGEFLSQTSTFLAIFKGFDASTQDLEDIGVEVVEDMLSSNYKLMCYELAMQLEIHGIETKLSQTDTEQWRRRLKFFNDGTNSCAELSKYLQYLS